MLLGKKARLFLRRVVEEFGYSMKIVKHGFKEESILLGKMGLDVVFRFIFRDGQKGYHQEI